MARLGRSQPAAAYKLTQPFPLMTSIPQKLWYALYDTTTGELLSLGTAIPVDIAPGRDYIIVADWDFLSNLVIWDTSLRLFVFRIPDVLIDRVTDLVNDVELASIWSTLSTAQAIALQTRIALMLGPYRWRFDFQDIDLT